jgi:hypothetical protein
VEGPLFHKHLGNRRFPAGNTARQPYVQHDVASNIGDGFQQLYFVNL